MECPICGFLNNTITHVSSICENCGSEFNRLEGAALGTVDLEDIRGSTTGGTTRGRPYPQSKYEVIELDDSSDSDTDCVVVIDAYSPPPMVEAMTSATTSSSSTSSLTATHTMLAPKRRRLNPPPAVIDVDSNSPPSLSSSSFSSYLKPPPPPSGPTTSISLALLNQPFTLTATERTAFLSTVISAPKSALDRARKNYEKGRKVVNLWDLMSSVYGSFPIPPLAKPPPPIPSGADGHESIRPAAGGRSVSAPASTAYCIRRLWLSKSQASFDARPLPPSSGPGEASVECSVCCGNMRISDVAFCEPRSASAPQHYACRPCLANYVLKTPRCAAASVTSIPCFASHVGKGGGVEGCDGLIPPAIVKESVGPLKALEMEEREAERSERVAMGGAGSRKIFCQKCQVIVGVVEEGDVGDGKVDCPWCGEGHCAKVRETRRPGRFTGEERHLIRVAF